MKTTTLMSLAATSAAVLLLGTTPAPASAQDPGAVVCAGSHTTTTLTTSGSRSCLDVPVLGPRTETILWDNGQSTTFEYTIVRVSEAGQTIITETGTVVQGLFAGRAVTVVITAPSLSLVQCATAQGVQSQGGPLVASFL